MSIHTRIKKRRVALFASQEAFALALAAYGVKVTWQSVQQWEKEDGTAPNRSRMPAVVAALKTTAEWLAYGTGVEVVGEQEAPQPKRLVAVPHVPKWMDEEAFRLLDLYYARDLEGRQQIMGFAQSLADIDASDAASHNG